MIAPAGNENAFLGALVGMAIGDALGLPLIGLAPDEIGVVDGYRDVPGAAEGEPVRGAISDRTEFALCMVESVTTNFGQFDPENINARLNFLTESGSRRWMSEQVLAGIDAAFEENGLVPTGLESVVEPSVAVRGVIVGLLHSVATVDTDAIAADAALVARLTHADAASIDAVTTAALIADQASRSVDRAPDWELPELPLTSDVALRVQGIGEIVKNARTFEDAVIEVVQAGGDTASYGALAGGLAGARFGAAGLPQHLIDDLDARIYLSMAAPWFYRTAMQRAGFAIDLHVIENEFPEF